MNALYIGIDVSKRQLVCQFMDRDGDILRPILSVDNNHRGAMELIRTIRSFAVTLDDPVIHIGMEATNAFWYHAAQLLRGELTDLAPRIYVLNPSVIKGFKRSYTTMPKTDAVDAWVIADRLRFGRVEPSPASEIEYDVLRRTTRFRFQLSSTLRREKQRALDLVFLKFTNYTEEAPFSVFSKASMALLEHFSPGEIAETDILELPAFLAKHSNNRLGGDKTPEDLAKDLRRAAQNSYRLHPEMQDAVDTTLAMTFDNVRFAQGQLKKANRVIERQFEAIPQTLTTIPGMGPVLGAGIVAEIGDIRKYTGQAALAKTAGLTWTRHQSGSFHAEETSLTKSGNKYLRYYLVEAANKVRMHTPEYRRYYQKKFAEVRKHQHKRALVLTARKLVRLVFALLSNGQIYRHQGGR